MKPAVVTSVGHRCVAHFNICRYDLNFQIINIKSQMLKCATQRCCYEKQWLVTQKLFKIPCHFLLILVSNSSCFGGKIFFRGSINNSTAGIYQQAALFSYKCCF
jgi:hypothetical protein